MLKNTIRTVLVLCAVTLMIGCSLPDAQSGLRLGEDIPAGAPVVKLADVLAGPAAFNDARVVLQGVVVSQCSSLCHFNFQDGVHSVTVYPQGFKFPRLDRGKNVTLYAQIISGEGGVVFSVLGLSME
jgi:uncharacterized protein YdeI (BOF family)